MIKTQASRGDSFSASQLGKGKINILPSRAVAITYGKNNIIQANWYALRDKRAKVYGNVIQGIFYENNNPKHLRCKKRRYGGSTAYWGNIKIEVPFGAKADQVKVIITPCPSDTEVMMHKMMPQMYKDPWPEKTFYLKDQKENAQWLDKLAELGKLTNQQLAALDKKRYGPVKRPTITPGLVYKTRLFWEHTIEPHGRVTDTAANDIVSGIQNVFDGAFNTKRKIFPYYVLYHHYLQAYSNKCSGSIRDRVKISHVVKRWGGNEPSASEVYATYYLERRVKDYYQSNYGAVKRFYIKIMTNAAMRGSSASSVSSIATTADDTMKRILGGMSCSSATMRQLNENFYRLTHRQPSLHASGGKIAGAEKESDKLP